MDSFLEKLCNSLFIGGIHHRRHGAACPAGGIGQFHAGVFVRIGPAEGQLPHLRQIQSAPGGLQAFRPAQAIEDRQFHVRPAKLGQHGGIRQFDHRMDDALGMNHDLDMVVIKAKQVMGLNHFQPFIHQGSGIHSDLATHAPVGMAGGIGHGGVLQISRIPVAESTT